MSAPNGTWPQEAIADPVTAGLDDRPLRVLVADYDGLARAMMRAALNDCDRIAIVLSAADGRETVQLARYYRPTVLVTELDIPPAGATDLITQVLAVSPMTRVLTISAGDPRAALQTLRAGAVGHIAKETDPEQLARIVEQVADGEPIIPSPLLGRTARTHQRNTRRRLATPAQPPHHPRMGNHRTTRKRSQHPPDRRPTRPLTNHHLQPHQKRPTKTRRPQPPRRDHRSQTTTQTRNQPNNRPPDAHHDCTPHAPNVSRRFTTP